MGFEFEIYDKDKYRQELINYYNSILDGRFLNLNPYEMSDEELMNNIPDGIPTNSSIWDINNSLCWLYIGESVEDNYNGNNYTYVRFYSDKSREKIVLTLTYSQLKYPMSLKTGLLTIDTESELISKIDGRNIEPEVFFSSGRIGDRILYLGYLPGVNRFGKDKACVDFAYRNVTPKQIRKYISQYQIDYLWWLDNFPTVSVPYTSEKIMMNGRTVSVNHNMKSIRTDEYAREIYLELFTNRVKSMRNEKEKRTNND